MVDQIVEKKLKLSIKNSLVLMLMYSILTATIILPFTFLSETTYIINQKALQAFIITAGTLVTNIITIRLICKKARKDNKVNFKISYIKIFNFKLLLCTLFLIGGYYLWYQSSIGIVTAKIPLPQIFEQAFKKITTNDYSLVILAAIIAPIFEEIIVRGIILEGLLNKYKPLTAIIISSFIFGIIHLDIPQIINATLLGILLGVIYYKTRSLILCISAHMLNNVLAFIILYTRLPFNIFSFFIGTIIFVIAGIFFIKYVKHLFTVYGSRQSLTNPTPIK